MASLMSIEDVNALSRDQFAWVFGNVVELCTDAALQAAKRLPFRGVDDLCGAFGHYLDNLTTEQKENIVRLHPDLAGTLAQQGRLTEDSSKEQHSAGLTDMTPEERDLLHYYNQHYKERFGYPFVICARENKLHSIVEGLMKRYNNHSSQEIHVAIEEVKKICNLRILDIVK